MDSSDDSPSCETCGVLFNSVSKLLQHTREQHWGKEEAGAMAAVNAPSASDDNTSQDEDADVSEQEGENASREGNSDIICINPSGRQECVSHLEKWHQTRQFVSPMGRTHFMTSLFL